MPIDACDPGLLNLLERSENENVVRSIAHTKFLESRANKVEQVLVKIDKIIAKGPPKVAGLKKGGLKALARVTMTFGSMIAKKPPSPDDIDCRVRTATLYARLGRAREARAEIETAMDQAASSSSALLTTLCPLPEELITGFTTTGKPRGAAAAFSSSRLVA